MRVFLHIGVWKTGSSAIQGFLRRNAKALRSAGVAAPRLSGRNNLPRLSSGDPTALDQAVGRLWDKARRQNATTLILSSEHFWPIAGNAQTNLANALSKRGADVSVIAYLRPQAEIWRSVLAQQAKSFRVRTGQPVWGDVSFVGARLAGPALYYGACLSRFRRNFGNVKVRRYIRRDFPDGDVIKDFVHVAGLDGIRHLNFNADGAPNPSLGWKGVALSIAIAEASGRVSRNRLHRAALMAAARAMASRRDTAEWLGRVPNFLTQADIDEINSRYADDMSKLARRFFNRTAPFAPGDYRPLDPFGPEYMNPEELNEGLFAYRRALIAEAPKALTKVGRDWLS